MKKQQLHTIAKIIAGQSPESSTYNSVGDGLPFFQGKADFQEKFPKVRIWCNSEKRKIAEPRDILMSVRAPVGSVNICNQTSIIGRGLSAIRPLPTLNYEYLYYFLKSNEQRISSLGTGSTFNAITQDTLKKIEIPLPLLDDQIRIAHLLGKVEGLISKRKEKLQKLDELLKSVFLEMYGDPLTNPKGLSVKTLNDVAVKQKNAIVDGPFGSSLKSTDYYEDGIPIIRINNIRDDGFYSSEFKYILESKYTELIRSKVVFNDILIARVGNTIGKTCIFDQHYKALLSTTGVAKVTLDNAIANIDFIIQQMRLPQYIKYIWNQTEGGGQPYLNLTKIKAFKLLLPPIEMQNQFAEIAKKIEGLKSHYKQSLSDLENLYGVLSQKAFNGELDLIRVSLPPAADPLVSNQLQRDKQDNPKLNDIKAGAAKSSDNIGNPAPFTNKSFEEFLSVRKDKVSTATALWQELQVNFENQSPNFESFKSLVMDCLDEGRWLEQVYTEVPVDDDANGSKVEKFKEKKVALRIRDDS